LLRAGQLKRENTHALKLVRHPRVKILAESLSTFTGTMNFATERRFEIGFRVRDLIKNTL
jgi:hypothetical protein